LVSPLRVLFTHSHHAHMHTFIHTYTYTHLHTHLHTHTHTHTYTCTQYPGMMFFQWLNASHNALVNYYNRNASSHTSQETFLQSYAAASATAMGVAVGLNMLIRKSGNLSPTMKTVIQRFVPFPAVALSNVANVTLMRQEELKSGINIFVGVVLACLLC
jgi:Sideroflexins